MTAAATTGDAAAQIAELGDPHVVAIASERAARLHALAVIASNVGDHPEAYTRFAALAPYTRLDRRHGTWRTALTFVTDHRPGALHRAIAPLASRDIDMVQLVSRPIPSTPWKYRFDAVLGGHPLDEDVSGALAEMQRETARLRVFGSYRADLEDEGATCATVGRDHARSAESYGSCRSGRPTARPYAASTAGSKWSSPGRYWRQTSGTRWAASRMKSTGAGMCGVRGSDIDASSSVLSPLRRLQGAHAVTTFSHTESPPRERGTTWSSVSRPAVDPQ